MSYDLQAAVRHVVHDYAYLVVAGHDTQNPLPHPFNHYAERTFLFHCRAFAGFFKGVGDPRDMYAKDFVDMPTTGAPAVWTAWHDHVDKHLAHLSSKRITNTIPWTGSDNKKILDGFQATWRDFFSKLKPSLKPRFDSEIAAMQKQFPGVPLA
jgi:hypothetical protein